MTTKNKKTEKPYEEVSIHDYEHHDDATLEDKKIEKVEELPVDKLEEVAKAEVPVKETIIPHFDQATEEFLKKINDLPTISPQTQEKIDKHYADKKQTWILSHITDDIFPIRFKVRDTDKTDKDYVRYKTKKVTKGNKTYNTFETEEVLFEGQSISPAHQHKLQMMQQKETILITKLEEIQQKINNVLSTRNLIAKVLERNEESTPEDKLSNDRLTELLTDFKKSVADLPEDFVAQVDKIQKDTNQAIYDRSRFLAYAYFAIEDDDYEDAFLSDIKDFTEVLQKRESLKVPT